jgi:hypothetical protein
MPNARGGSGSVTNSRFPRRLEQFRTRAPLQSVSFTREVAWVAAQIMEEAQRIERFLDLKAAYEHALCRGASAECFTALDTLEEELGFSFWSIEARIGALQLYEGLEAQKNYLAQIRKARPSADVVSFVAHHVSRKLEPSTLPTRFANSFATMTAKWDSSNGLIPYLNFRVAGIEPVSVEACANVLRHETPGSIIDQYETLVDLAKIAATVGSVEMTMAFDAAVERIASAVQDERLAKIMAVRGNPAGLARLTFVTDAASDLMLIGNVRAAMENIEGCIAERPNDPVLWLLRARIAELTREAVPAGTPPAESAPHNLQALVSEDTDSDQAIIPLLRLSIGFHNLSFAPSLLLYAWRALPSGVSAGGQLEQIAFIERSGARADELAVLPESIRQQYLDAALASLSVTPSLTRAATIVGRSIEGMPELCPTELFRANVEASLLHGENRAALHMLLPQVGAKDAEQSRWAIRVAAKTMASLDDEHVDLARFIVTRATQRPGLVRSLPVAECVARLDEEARTELKRELTLPIILHLAVQNDDGLADACAYAYEDFLIANGLARPSQLDTVVGNFDRTQLAFYLRYLCIPEIMQVSSAFQSTRELQEERIAVLRLLVEIDPDNSKVYEDELREVTRSLLVHSGVRHIGQTKIFVDVPALRRWAERNLKEDFSRFQSHLQAGLGIDREIVSAMVQRLEERKPIPTGMLELPKNESTDLLVKMTVTLNQEFLTNPDHGLDCYLSMRIRHGTLAGQLRTPLEVEHLITQRRAPSDEYTSNEHWAVALQQHRVDPQALDERLARFSRDYDDLIAEMSNDLIQIRSSERPNGLFDAGILSGQLLVLSADFTPDLTFDQFLDGCFKMYWDRVDVCLDKVRDVCNAQLKPRITRMFNSLDADVAPLAGAARLDLERAIRSASTGANQALDIVADWFRLPAPIEIQVFPIEAMIDVGLKCVTTIYPEFHPTLSRTGLPDLPPFRDALAFFSDVFFIVFDNIRRHSGLTGPEVELGVEISAPSRLRIRVLSDIGDDVDVETIEGKLARIRERIVTDDYRSAVISEGGTGLIKLHRILRGRNRETNMLKFGFDGDRFLVEFEIVWRETST